MTVSYFVYILVVTYKHVAQFFAKESPKMSNSVIFDIRKFFISSFTEAELNKKKTKLFITLVYVGCRKHAAVLQTDFNASPCQVYLTHTYE